MRQWTIDAFASGPFKGNPACVVEPFDIWPPAQWMQALAQENNQAETAFLLRTDDPGRYGLRWFTPTVEVPMCGHATLASAHALFSELGADAPLITFDTLSGPLTVARTAGGYEMDFPSNPSEEIAVPAKLEAILGAAPIRAYQSQRPMAGSQWLTVELQSESAVRSLTPDPVAIARDVGLLIVTALADPGRPYQVVSRVFVSEVGIAEDPATGAAHTVLAPIFSARLGRASAGYHQAYPGRGGDLECEHRGERVVLRGSAMTVAQSVLRLDPQRDAARL